MFGHAVELLPDEGDEIPETGFRRDLGALHRVLEGGQLPGVGVLEERQEQVFFVLEVRVDRPLGEAGRGRHLVEGGRVEPPLGEDLGGGLEQVLAGELAAAVGGEWIERHRGLCYLPV